MTCTNEYRPIPEGFIAIADYAKEHGLDLVQLACAVFRGDMKGWRWMLKKGQGTKPCDTVVIVVAEDDIAPAYIDRRDWAQDKRNADLEEKERRHRYSINRLKGDMPCKVDVRTIRKWLQSAGYNTRRIATNDAEYAVALACCKKAAAEVDSANTARRNAPPVTYQLPKMKIPEGYEFPGQAAMRWRVHPRTVRNACVRGQLAYRWYRGIRILEAGQEWVC